MTGAAVKPGTLLTSARGAPVLVRLWIAEGSYAAVYQGAYGLDGLPCAVKVPKREESAEELIRRQGDILERVSGPGIVRLLDRGHANGTPFLVLEWLEGGSLADLLGERRRLPLRQVLEIIEQLGTALAEFHRHGLAHGDVRPENLVLQGPGVVLIDPHPLPVGNVPPPSVPADLTAAAGLLHRMLTGGGALSAAAGYSREVVQLDDDLRSGRLTALDLARRTAELRRRL